MTWWIADSVLGVPVDQINAISQLGLTGGALVIIGLFLIGKIVAGYLLDRAEKRADGLQTALDAAVATNQAIPKAIADLTAAHERETAAATAAHEREVASLTTELRRLSDAR